MRWRSRAARFWTVAIVFVSSRVARVAGGCREAHVQIYGARHRFSTSIIDMVLRSLGHLLIFQREGLIFLRVDLEIFTPCDTEFAMTRKG